MTGKPGSVHLPPKAMEVLLVLTSNAGALVTREALLDEVWGTGHGSKETLGHAISEIRHALNDHADNPEFIQTLPKRGYRLIVGAGKTAAHSSTVILGPGNGTVASNLSLFENLNQRGVLETSIAYLILGWLLIQVADIVFGQLLLPAWTGTFVTVLVIAGFPIAIALSWFLEFRDGRAVLQTQSAKDESQRKFSRTYLSVVGALAIAAVLVFMYDQTVGLPQAEPPTIVDEPFLAPVMENSVAVLPFFNVDGSEQTQIFSYGLADDVITQLSHVPGLKVSARGDSFTLEPNTSSDKVRERLRVARYLEGSIQIDGGLMRVIIQLIDSETGFHVLSRTYDPPVEDFFTMRDQITELIVDNIRSSLPTDIQMLPAEDHEISDLQAYIAYRKGKETYEKPQTIESIAEAINYYEQAIELEPLYAAALAGKCDAFVARYYLSNSADDIALAESACASAHDANPRSDSVYSALGELYRRTNRTSEAEEAFDKALVLNPQSADAMIGLAKVYRRQQKYSEAEKLYHAAMATQPGNWRIISSLGSFHFSMGRYADAANAYRKVVYLDYNNLEARTNLGSALTMAGDFAAGKLVFEETLNIEPSYTAYSNLGVIYYYLGQFKESVATHRKAVELAPRDAVRWLNLADSLHFAGEKKEAQEMFRRADELSSDRLAIDSSNLEAIYVHAWSRQMLGDSESAQAGIAKGFQVAPKNPYGFYYDSLIRTQLGDYGGAIESLKAAIENGYPVKMLDAEPYLDELRLKGDYESLAAESD